MGFNQNRFCILCLISIFILGSADKVRASALETWVEQSDIICTARVLTVDKSYTERVMMHGYPYLATSVTLRVRVPIKGSIADQQILVKTQRADLSNILTGAGYYPFYNGFKVGENYILFAKKNMEAGSYSLTNPYDETQSAVSIKDPTFDIPTDGSVIDRTVIYLANELSVGNKAQKLYDLGLLGDYGKSLLTTRLTRYNPIDATRAASMHLMKTKITSAVLKLTTDSDSEIHDLALLNAAELQVPQVIPELELLSEGSSPYAGVGLFGLGEYETVDSLPEMLLVLNSKQHDVKKVVLEYLIKVQDRRAVPTLIDALDDSSDDLRIDALVALQNTVGQGPTNWHMGQDKDVVAYWKNWAVQHQDELIRLRSQLKEIWPTSSSHF